MSALVLRLVGRALVNPRTARALLVMGWRFRRDRWWARAPFLPVPAREYIRWRMYTAYGDAVREAILSYTEIPPPVVENMTLPRWSATLDVESITLIGELANEFGELDEIPSTDDIVQPGA